MRYQFPMTVITLLSVSPPVLAQTPPTGLPTAMLDLNKVSIGQWADYVTTVDLPGANATVKTRWALVGREKGRHVLETIIEAPVASEESRTIMRIVMVTNSSGHGGRIVQMTVKKG